MKVKIIMKSGNVYTEDIEKAKDIKDVYVALHLDHDCFMVLNDETIINTSEVGEVQIVNDNKIVPNYNNFQNEIYIPSINIYTTDIDSIINELSEKLKQDSSQRL